MLSNPISFLSATINYYVSNKINRTTHVERAKAHTIDISSHTNRRFLRNYAVAIRVHLSLKIYIYIYINRLSDDNNHYQREQDETGQLHNGDGRKYVWRKEPLFSSSLRWKIRIEIVDKYISRRKRDWDLWWASSKLNTRMHIEDWTRTIRLESIKFNQRYIYIYICMGR